MNTVNYLIFVLAVIVSLLFPQHARSHGTKYQVLVDHAAAITVLFSYSNDEPLRYAEVLIFGPEDKKIEYQNGRTDRQGRFAFCPDRKGNWRMRVNDGMGHTVNAEIDVPETVSPTIAGTDDPMPHSRTISRSSNVVKIAAGLSLMINVFFAVYLWKGRTCHSRERK